MPDPSPALLTKLLSIAVRGENLIVRCHRESLRGQLLEHGHRAFFDRIEGYGPAGWRLHFFCLDPAAVTVLHDIGQGACGPGDPASFDPEKFIERRLRQVEQAGRLGRPNEWWDLDLWV